MKWIKKGQLLDPKEIGWSKSHAAVPFALQLDDNQVRIFFSTRDEKNQSHTAWMDCIIDGDNIKIIEIANSPILSPGNIGCFDDSGAMGSCIVRTNDEIRLYYTGWNLGITVPFRFSIGVSKSHHNDANNFTKVSEGPILDRNIYDPYLMASPYIIQSENKWEMWYVSGRRWIKSEQGIKHYYNIGYANSEDGMNWKRNGKICINFDNAYEYAIARPSVLIDKGIYRMWYCYRASKECENYRIGYAESFDGLEWKRMDDRAGIDVSDKGWDSEMICYPHVFKYKDKFFMLYNGNNYGETGVGYAVATII